MFETKYTEIIKIIESFEVNDYQKTRNFLDGKVSYLSTYITHGVVSVEFIANILIKKYGLKGLGNAEHFIFQLGWREYFYKIWYEIGDGIFSPIKNAPNSSLLSMVPRNIIQANTGIQAIDNALKRLYETGYIHNHERMWIASILCNLNKTSFKPAADWMFYYLLDGDFASNYLSWQWVAGTFSSKKYLCNQENLNKYSKTVQKNTPIDCTYEELNQMAEDHSYCLDLGEREFFELPLFIPEIEIPKINFKKQKLALFSIWTLDPNFENNQECEKILLIEPSVLKKHRMSRQRIQFILNLAKNILDIKIIVMDYVDFKNEIVSKYSSTFTKSHPACMHWNGVKFYDYEYLFSKVNPPFRSYFDFWNKSKKVLKQKYG